MSEAKGRISSAIDRARADLELALHDLEKLPVVSKDAVGFASHALNNYITVTGGAVELLGMMLADHPNPEVARLLGAMRRSTDLMTCTVAQMRSDSAGWDSSVILDKVNLGVMTRRFTEFYQALADRKQISCIFEPAEQEALVWTDHVMTAVVLDNLLSNAVKFSPAGSCVRISLSLEQERVACKVRDEGPGIGPEDQAKLFQRGGRLTPQPTGGESSTGYGLAVAKEFIDKLGGTIWYESRPGEGSCFAFRLTRYQEQIHGPGRSEPWPSTENTAL